MKFARLLLAGAAGISSALALGCGDDHPHPAPAGTTATGAAADHAHGPAADHAHGPDGEHATPTTPATAPSASAAGHGGAVIALGTATAGPFTLVATRDQGTIDAGKDAPIDVTVTPAAGATAKATAVRFWIGTQDAKGSAKGKAEVENAAEPNRWHTHIEVPDPVPADAKLWVEVEGDGGAKSVASFDLKR